RALNVADAMPVPARGPEYGAKVWSAIEQDVAASRRGRWPLTAPWQWVSAAAAIALLVMSAFFAGRFFPYALGPYAQPPGTARDSAASERILLVAVSDHLERSQRVLSEIANAALARLVDITTEQQRAADLITENRLYRQTAATTGDAAVASVLEDLER